MNKQTVNGIPYCDYTWNPITGCLHGCPYCYARRIAHRWHGGFKPAFHPERLGEPRKVKKPAWIFVGDMGDMFGNWVPREQIEAVFQIIRETPWHVYLLLTKNPKRYQEFNIPDNCLIGTTCENQGAANLRVTELLKARAKWYFVSHEPALGPIDWTRIMRESDPVDDAWIDGVRDHWTFCDNALTGFRAHKAGGWYGPRLSLVIVGAQSGPDAVPMDEDWVRSERDQCLKAGVPFFYKQAIINGKKVQLPVLDGRQHNELPKVR
jgi:protein gp37